MQELIVILCDGLAHGLEGTQRTVDVRLMPIVGWQFA